MGGSYSKQSPPSVAINIGKYPEGSRKQAVTPDEGDGKYYYEIDSKRINLERETYSTENGQYSKLKHTPADGTVGKINSKYYIKFMPPPSDIPSVTVFYSKADGNHETPLIVQFGQGNNYYTTDNGYTWNKQSDINTGTLNKNLDEQNCKIHNRHVVNLSEKRLYNCPRCNGKPISVDSSSLRSDYTYYTHSIRDCCIGEFMDNTKLQTGITSTNISTVYVYLLEWDTPKPLLINIQGSTWYQRKGIDLTEWISVSNKPSSLSDSTNIPKILLSYYSSSAVTIDVGDTKVDRDRESTMYPDPSEGGSKQINLTRHDIKLDEGETEYTSFVHSVQGKAAFILGGIKHSESGTLSGISSNLILTSVTAYYSVKGPELKVDDLLMVCLEKRSGLNKYAYYSRGSGGSRWSAAYERPDKLDDTELVIELNQLKDQVDAEKNKSDRSDGLGLSSQVRKGLKIGGGVLGGLTTVGTVAGLVKKFWGTIATTLITSM